MTPTSESDNCLFITVYRLPLLLFSVKTSKNVKVELSISVKQ